MCKYEIVRKAGRERKKILVVFCVHLHGYENKKWIKRKEKDSKESDTC